MKTEYLALINTKDNCCSNKTTFENYLMSNSELTIQNNFVIFKGNKYLYKIQTEPISNSTYTYFHITLELSELNPSIDSDIIIRYEEFLRVIRTMLFKLQSQIEILWDDLSFLYSSASYPLIYEIENLMRKLLSKFMMVNVGAKWQKENIPLKISKSKNIDKNTGNSNLGNSLLYKLDFIELSTFLFDEYAFNNNLQDLKKLISSTEPISPEKLSQFIPISNWERYFKKVVNVENEFLQKQWTSLYELRCKVAHNNLLTREDYKKIKQIVGTLKPSIENALEQLDQIRVEETLKERMSEDFMVSHDASLGKFINEYRNLESILSQLCSQYNILDTNKTSIIPFNPKYTTKLKELDIITMEDLQQLNRLRYARNNLVHHTDFSIDEDHLNKYIVIMQNLAYTLSNKILSSKD